MNSLILFIYNLLIHLTNDISHLIKLLFNTSKFTRRLDALLFIEYANELPRHRPISIIIQLELNSYGP
jgi:hypothetical protein